MGVLSDIIKVKALEDEKARQTAKVVTDAITIFGDRQKASALAQLEAEKIDIRRKTLSESTRRTDLLGEIGRERIEADLASKGLRRDELGNIVSDKDLEEAAERRKRAGKGREKKFIGVGGEPSEFDPQATEETLFELFKDKSEEDFELDLEDLAKNRKLYEDMGVDVIQVLRRAKDARGTAVFKKKNFLANILELL